MKLFEKTADKGESSYFNKYVIGRELGLVDEREVDRIVKILLGDGLVANYEGNDSKIQITAKCRIRLENNHV